LRSVCSRKLGQRLAPPPPVLDWRNERSPTFPVSSPRGNPAESVSVSIQGFLSPSLFGSFEFCDPLDGGNGAFQVLLAILFEPPFCQAFSRRQPNHAVTFRQDQLSKGFGLTPLPQRVPFPPPTGLHEKVPSQFFVLRGISGPSLPSPRSPVNGVPPHERFPCRVIPGSARFFSLLSQDAPLSHDSTAHPVKFSGFTSCIQTVPSLSPPAHYVLALPNCVPA